MQLHIIGLTHFDFSNIKNGLLPIQTAWEDWNKQNLLEVIPDQVKKGVTYGMTLNETADDKGKYVVCTEVTSLANLPV